MSVFEKWSKAIEARDAESLISCLGLVGADFYSYRGG